MVFPTLPTLSLKGLRDCAAGQEAAIQDVLNHGLLRPLPSSKPDSQHLVDFWKSVWGQAMDPRAAEKDLNPFDELELEFDRGEDPINDYTITSLDPYNPPSNYPDSPPYHTYRLVPKGRHIMKTPPALADIWGFNCSQFLVRSEYKEAETAAMAAFGIGAEVFTVTGNPGIGKTVFLVRLLIRRLSLGLPTALQFAPDCAHLFCEKGVYEFGRLDNPELYNKLRRGTDARIWALIDSNDDLVQPAALFTNRSPFFVVEAAPPLDDHFEWMKKAHTMRFYMKPWTFPEVCQARTLVIPGDTIGERDLWNLYRTYGASPRLLFKYVTQPEEYKKLVVKAVDSHSMEDIFSALTLKKCTTADSHFAVLIEPSRTNRATSQAKIITRPVFQIIWDRHLANDPAKAGEFYQLAVREEFESTAAEWNFRSEMHRGSDLLAEYSYYSRLHGFHP